MDRRATGAASLLLASLVATAAGAGCGAPSQGNSTGSRNPTNEATSGQQELGGATALSVDPCSIFTDSEIQKLISTTDVRRQPSGTSHSRCTLGSPSAKLSVHVSVFGDAVTAPDVFNDQMRFGQDPHRVLGVGRAAFAVSRSDEVGLVVLTDETVLAVSLVASYGTVSDQRALLARLTPVVQKASARL